MHSTLALMLAATLTSPALAQTAPATTPPAPVTEPAKAPSVPGWQDFFESDSLGAVSEGHTFTEGPCWVKDGAAGFFVFCDRSPGNSGQVFRWNGEGSAEAWRTPSGLAIGVASDGKGTLYFAETQERRITKATMKDGKVGEATPIAEKLGGKRLNATNDVVVRRDGSVYFTDPTFFTDKKDLELDFKGVCRVGADGAVTAVDTSLSAPNGLCFSPDEKRLYVNDYMAAKVIAFDVKADGTLEGKREFADLRSFGVQGRGQADGLRCDAKGNVYTTGPGGVLVLSPEGKLEGTLAVPGPTNLAFGGKDGKTLVITAGRRVFHVRTKHAGASLD